MSDPTYAAPAHAVSPVDRVVTVLLMICVAVLAPIAGFMGLLTAMASDGCTASSCHTALIGLGVGVSAAGRWWSRSSRSSG